MFGKAFEVSMNRVRDRVKIREGADSLVLTVDGDPYRMVIGMKDAMEKMGAVGNDEQAAKDAALYFAEVIFGRDQAQKMMEFYNGKAECVAGVCGQYLTQRLGKLIEKAQKK